MSLPRYPAYRESGVEWLGEVPAHWDVVPLKMVASVNTGVAKGKDHKGQGTISVPYLRVANVQDGYLDLSDVANIDILPSELERYALQPGDVLMNEGGDFDKLGRGCAWDGQISPCITQNHVFAVRPLSVSPRWLSTVIGSRYAQFFFMTRSKQSTNLASISSTNLMELPVIRPPVPEQEVIGTFLDCETARIDALIAEQERLIELLNEKRQAVISHAVTKGLNPGVPMKDSGIEWLGPVPTHWGTSKLKYAARFMSGGTPSKERLDFWNGSVPWASSKDLKSDAIADTQDHITELALENGARVVASGHILVVVRGMILARVFPVSKTLVPMAINQDLKAIRPHDDWDGDYFASGLRASSRETLGRLDEAGHGTKALRMEAWLTMGLPKPPLTEQAAIGSFLQSATARLDALIAEAHRSTELLQERRSAVVSAAVTGQIDVRPESMRTAA